MSASKMLDLAEQQGLLDEKVLSELRRQLRESKFVVTPEALAKVLVDHEHLTNFQARKLVASASEAGDAITTSRQAQPAAAKPMLPMEDDEDEIIDLEPAAPPAAPVAAVPTPTPKSIEPSKPAPPAKPVEVAKPAEPAKPAFDSMELAPLDMDEPSNKSAPKPTPTKTEPSPAAAKPTQSKPQTPAKPSKPAEKSTSKPSAKPAPKPAVEEELQELQELEVLTPLPATAPAPIDDLFAADALAGPAPLGGDPLLGGPLAGPLAGPLGQPGAPATPVGPPKKKNQWDSPLLLIGGGALGVLILAAGLLVYSLTRGSASELFQKGEEEYRNGAYATAIAVYDDFLKKYPADPNSSLAKVRRGMAQIRQVTDKANDPSQGLKAAQRVLPQIEIEATSFNEARPELASILPEIADGFATKAKDEPDTAKRQSLVASAEEAISLVNNPAYIPTSMRKDQEVRIGKIIEKLEAARRSIDQDRDLYAAVEKMTAAADANQALEGYTLRRDLLKKYPALEASEALFAATLKLSASEQSQTQVSDQVLPAAEAVQPTGVIAVALTHIESPAAASAASGLVPVVAEGSLHAFDVATGQLKWHKYVGQGAPPVVASPSGDWLAVDVRNWELQCCDAATGAIKWRYAPGERFFGPVVAAEVCYITLESGKIHEVSLADGSSPRQVSLPQSASTAVCLDSRRSRIYQLGDHSTLFAFRMETLACEETHFLGHLAGSILVPPLVVLDHVVIAESPGTNYSVLRILVPSGEKKLLTPLAKSFRLTGRVQLPMVTASRRVIAVTDLGQTSVIEIDPTSPTQSVREISKLEATDSQPVLTYLAVEGNQVWLAGQRASNFEIQASLAQLSRKWTLHPGDSFVSPLQLASGLLVHVRRRPQLDGLIVEACNPADGKAVWSTRIAQQIAAMMINQAKAEVFAATRGGLLYSIPREALTQGMFATPQLLPPLGGVPMALDSMTPLSDDQLLISGFSQGNRAILCNIAEKEKSRYIDLAKLTSLSPCAPAKVDDGILVPHSSGPVQVIDPLTGESPVFPFSPPLKAGVKLKWLPPVVLDDGNSVVLSDGDVMLYRLLKKSGAPPQLALAAEGTTPLPLARQLAKLSTQIIAVGRGEASDSLLSINSQSLAATEKKKLRGRVTSGPHAVLEQVIVAAEPDGLISIDAAGEIQWEVPFSQTLAAPPIVQGADLVLVSTTGEMIRIEAATGKTIAAGEIGRSVTSVSAVLGPRLAIAGADGQLLFVPIPKTAP